MIDIKKKQSIFFFAFIAIVLAIGFYRYYDYVIMKNFIIQTNTVCNPGFEECFMRECTIDDIDCNSSVYKKVKILATKAPECLIEHTCKEFSCDDIVSCVATYCSDETLEDGEVCVSAELEARNIKNTDEEAP